MKGPSGRKKALSSIHPREDLCQNIQRLQKRILKKSNRNIGEDVLIDLLVRRREDVEVR